VTTSDTAAPERSGGAAGSVVLGVVLGLLVQASGVMLSFIALYLALRLGLPRSTLAATLVLDLVELAAWFVAGAVAYEIARRRGAVVATAFVPLLLALGVLVLSLGVGRGTVSGHALALIPLWLALPVVAYLGGRWWEGRIRRTRPVE